MTQDLERNGNQTNRSRSPGDVLMLAHELWSVRAGICDGRDLASNQFGIGAQAFDAIREFHQRVISRPKDEPLILCRGVSCRLHGADDFHAVLKRALEAAGALGKTVEVHCLSQCEHGPNVKLGDEVLCTGKGCVVNDARPWRPVTAGPRPVDSSLPPVAM
jgi:hypothetical protein